MHAKFLIDCVVGSTGMRIGEERGGLKGSRVYSSQVLVLRNFLWENVAEGKRGLFSVDRSEESA